MPDSIWHPVFLDIFRIPGRALLARNDREGIYSKLSLYTITYTFNMNIDKFG
jgi:hypothetical protein